VTVGTDAFALWFVQMREKMGYRRFRHNSRMTRSADRRGLRSVSYHRLMDPFREQVPFAPTDNFDAKGTETSEDRDAAKEAVSLHRRDS
jgi:hypothetical protein